MICGVKYCGGCNSRYNRTAFLERVKNTCPNVEFQYVQPEAVYHYLLVICGCPSKCADISKILIDGNIYMISEENQFENLVEKIKKTVDTCRKP